MKLHELLLNRRTSPRMTCGNRLSTTLAFLLIPLSVTVRAAEVPLHLSIRRAAKPELSWPSRTGFLYRVEYLNALMTEPWKPLGTELPGTGQSLLALDENQAPGARFYRLVELPAPSQPGTISPNAQPPLPAQLYLGGTILGSPDLGFQFTIPAAWKGGLREGTASLIFGSDTEPGLVLGVMTLAGDAAFVVSQISGPIPTGDGFGGVFEVLRPAVANGDKITAEWSGFTGGIQVVLRAEARVHPSGGVVGFIGAFTPDNRAGMERVLQQFSGSIVVTPRATDAQAVNAIAGRAFSWASYKSTGNGGTSGSLSRWSEKNAFFCKGTYEITTRSESSYGGSLSGGAFYTGGSSSSSTEAGDWTVIKTASGTVMVMISSSGIQAALISATPAGNGFYFGDNEFSFSRMNPCP
jgi:hypothetical protein